MNVSAHRIIKPAKEQRVFFCGDVHGNYSLLQKQLSEIGFLIGKDILILTGDIIDRGVENKEMLEFVSSEPDVYSVLGNHELMFLNAMHDELVRTIYMESRMGGSWIENHSQAEIECMATQIKSCMSIAITVEEGTHKIGVIHAAAPSSWKEVLSLTPENFEYYLLSRKQFEEAKNGKQRPPILDVDLVVHGHVCNEILASGNQVWIDTHWATGKLSIIESKDLIAHSGHNGPVI